MPRKLFSAVLTTYNAAGDKCGETHFQASTLLEACERAVEAGYKQPHPDFHVHAPEETGPLYWVARRSIRPERYEKGPPWRVTVRFDARIYESGRYVAASEKSAGAEALMATIRRAQERGA